MGQWKLMRHCWLFVVWPTRVILILPALPKAFWLRKTSLSLIQGRGVDSHRIWLSEFPPQLICFMGKDLTCFFFPQQRNRSKNFFPGKIPNLGQNVDIRGGIRIPGTSPVYYTGLHITENINSKTSGQSVLSPSHPGRTLLSRDVGGG